jgi:hypothetical protein
MDDGLLVMMDDDGQDVLETLEGVLCLVGNIPHAKRPYVTCGNQDDWEWSNACLVESDAVQGSSKIRCCVPLSAAISSL